MIFDEIDNLVTTTTKIKVIGVGGAGKNALNHMIENQVRGVEFIAVNTDAQDLKITKSEHRLLIGKTKTHGQGAGANPEVGRAAALESEDDIHEMIGDAQMVVITCGMGGGTGTGAAPVIAKVAREHGCLTIGICTKPFPFEGPIRMQNAIEGLEQIKKYVDTLVVIPNQRLLQTLPRDVKLLDAFREADKVLRKAVQGVSEIISIPGVINVDFADIKSVMQNKGTALLGIGAASGPDRAVQAAREAIHSSLLEVSIDGATDAVVYVTSNQNIGLNEVNEAIAEIRNNSGRDLNIIYGSAINNSLNDELIITVIATGYELKAQNNGYDDIAQEIFRNMSDTNITYQGLNDDVVEENVVTNKSEAEERINEIFDNGNLDKRQEKRLLKAEAKRQKALEKEAKKNEKKNKQPFNAEPTYEEEKKDTTKYPDWLRK